jgi:hypothetical protein
MPCTGRRRIANGSRTVAAAAYRHTATGRGGIAATTSFPTTKADAQPNVDTTRPA